MSLLFVWSPRDAQDPAAFDRFSSVLESQRTFYEGLFGRSFRLELRRVGPICLGQIQFDLGVSGWQPSADADGVGLFWSGICEDFLGVTLGPQEIREIVDRAERDPRSIGEWDGRFALCSWNEASGRVIVTPGSVESPSLWHTDGPGGWAFGSRAAPLLELTGRPAEVDVEAVSAFADFEYLIGEGPLFAGVQRHRPRQQVVIERDRSPVFRKYLSLGEFFAAGAAPPSWQDRIATGAERLTERIRRQLRHSPSPVLLLTGGYDSRCIAAAAIRAGYPGAAFTSGGPDSPDVRIASEVVRRLGVRHRTSHGDPVRPVEGLVRSPERLELWTRWTEGVDVLRQALPYRAFFEGRRPFPASRVQLLHGFGGGLLRGNRYLEFEGALHANTPERIATILRKRTSRTLVLRRSTDPLLSRALAEIAADLPPGEIKAAQWFTAYTWQSKCLRWGTDMFSARDLIDWHWTPYMDRILLRITWEQTNEERLSHRFLVNLATELSPALADAGYLGHGPPAPPSRPPGFFARIQQARRTAAHRRVWQSTLLSRPPRIWDQVVSREELTRLYEEEPLCEALGCLATAETTAKAFDAAPYVPSVPSEVAA